MAEAPVPAPVARGPASGVGLPRTRRGVGRQRLAAPRAGALDLRRLRLRLTLQFAALAGVVVLAVTLYAVRSAVERIEADALREGQDRLAGLALEQVRSGERSQADNTWLVAPEVGEIEPLGEGWVEPPLLTLGSRAVEAEQWGGLAELEFAQDGQRFLGVGQGVGGGRAVVTVVGLDGYDAQAASLRLRLFAAAGLGLLAASLVGSWLAGRALRPAREAMEQQRDFIADAAHELRTPLAVIQASASQTLSRDRDAVAYREALGEINAATARAGAAVGELLELARLEAGQAMPRLAPLRLDLLVEEVGEAAWASVAGPDGSRGQVVANTGVPVLVDGDHTLLRQAVDNVVRNAVARADRVEVGLETQGRDAVVVVRDDGPGFPPEVLPHVFQRFRRGDHGGAAGLGMAIARSILEAHGGHASAANRLAPDGTITGAEVRLALPLAR